MTCILFFIYYTTCLSDFQDLPLDIFSLSDPLSKSRCDFIYIPEYVELSNICFVGIPVGRLVETISPFILLKVYEC